MVGCRTGLVLALITMVTSEMIARTDRRRQHPVQRARHGAVRHGLRDDRHHRHSGLPRATAALRGAAPPDCSRWAAPVHEIAGWGRHDVLNAAWRRNISSRGWRCRSLLVLAHLVCAWRRPEFRAGRRCCRRRSRCSRRLLRATRRPAILADMPAPRCIRLFAGFGIARGARREPRASWRPAAAAVAALLQPVVRVLAPVPKIALYPALVLIFGFEHSSKVALVVADALFPILLATYQGAIGGRAETGRGRRAPPAHRKRRCLFTIVLTAALPSILTGAPHRTHHLLHRGVPGRDDHCRPTASGTCWCGPRATSRPSTCSCRSIAISMLGLLLNAALQLC